MSSGSNTETRSSSLPPSSEAPSDDVAGERDLWKRKYYAVLGKIPGDHPESDLPSNHRKKKRRTVDAVSTVCLGRGIPKLVSLFDDLRTITEQADYEEMRKRKIEGADVMLEDCTEEEKEVILADQFRAYNSREALNKLLPNVHEHVRNYSPEQLVQYYNNLEKGANDARSADIMGIRRALATWLNSELPPPSPILDPDSRTNRGVQHDICGRLLCPVDYDWDDPSVKTKLRNLEDGHDMSSSFFIRCLYYGYQGDPDNYQKGFLKSALLIKVYKHLFTSPSSAKTIDIDINDTIRGDEENRPPPPNIRNKSTRKSSVRKNVSNTLQMNNEVTPRAIAYSAVMLAFNLSSANTWGTSDEDMDYHSLYNFIIDYFDAAEGVQAKRDVKTLLSWWNKMVYPNARPNAPVKSAGSMKKLQQQRAAAEKARGQ